jgi:AcrR family transcriptional regulator
MVDRVVSPGLRQRKKERLRAALSDAAIELFIERGVDRTTVDDIVARVDVSRRTFFRYFESKEDACFFAADETWPELERLVRAAPAEQSPLVVARNAFATVLISYYGSDEHFAVAQLLTTTPQLKGKLAAVRSRQARRLAEALAARIGCAADDLAVRIIAENAVATANAALVHWVLEGGTRPLPTVMEEACRCADEAVRAPELSAADERRARSRRSGPTAG